VVAQDDGKNYEAHMAMKRRMKGGPRKKATSFTVVMKKCLTTPNIKGEYNRKGASERSGDGLATQLKRFLPTPRAFSAKGRPPGQTDLERQLKYLATPRNRTGGKANTQSGKRHETVSDQLGGQVNPDWKDWFCGFPIGWSAIEPLETQSYQSWLRKHSLSL
jgi:hypothetical protein